MPRLVDEGRAGKVFHLRINNSLHAAFHHTLIGVSEVDWKQGEWPDPEGHGQEHKVPLGAGHQW